MLEDETPVPGEWAEADTPEAGVLPEETPADAPQVEPVTEAALDETPRAGLLERVWSIFSGGNNRVRRLEALDWAIQARPEAPMNYVLRGELYSEMGEDELALEDFEWALEQASRQVNEADWGVVAQAVQDRALRGLEQAQRRLNRKAK